MLTSLWPSYVLLQDIGLQINITGTSLVFRVDRLNTRGLNMSQIRRKPLASTPTRSQHMSNVEEADSLEHSISLHYSPPNIRRRLDDYGESHPNTSLLSPIENSDGDDNTPGITQQLHQLFEPDSAFTLSSSLNSTRSSLRARKGKHPQSSREKTFWDMCLAWYSPLLYKIANWW